ncbi:mycofactocin oligosaccharide methyltransferase MftM [Pseudonocardia sp. KRD291]|uniref:mycofactocin oligosaccharide methyltransferase MftM n=1 Tax=Pseudonocardia sp. KRD291 TaxID=2792007 RepID=UPI001C49FB63|nr:mycofactocin oligosaccharide methyltransferase MftM [Pseudonocardia sp. KRD291]MBW0105063.1 class I SAM-dependent methyltransferase [Pseudonocardia sp. KRD291]
MIGLDQLSNDLAGWLDTTFVQRGLLAPEAFEEAFVAVVTGAAKDPDAPDDAWLAFYRNTVDALASEPVPGGTNAEMKPVHERAQELVAGDEVLELGCCFGFLSLRLAAAGYRVTATDLTGGTVELLSRMAPQLGADLDAMVADARAVARPDGCADTVLAVHLIEHLPEAEGDEVVAEMLRLARRRVVVAVPFEDEASATWGHVRLFDTAVLDAMGRRTGRPFTVSEHHGGWLVIDV